MRVRFAPSPTGNLHIGSVRTALFNWVVARHHKGTFVLRVEDTDLERSEKAFEENILDGMRWLGLDWDEGPDSAGDYGPYRQSERMADDIYQTRARDLIDAGLAYYAFETEEELNQEREAAEAQGIAYKYSGKSRGLSAEEVQSKLDQGVSATVRFHIPKGRTVVINDMVRGDVSFDTGLLSDFIILKSDGSPSYNFAVVIDDMEMAITHVIRGEDHISNTPRQILLYEAFDQSLPKFAHLPIILGPDKSKLSKRHGAQAVTDYQNAGYMPEALLNYLSLLGWSPPTENEILSLEELVRHFSIERISKSGAVFDETKLKWMNGQYIRRLDGDQLLKRVFPFLSDNTHSILENRYPGRVANVCVSVQGNLDVLSDIENYVRIYIMDEQAVQVACAEHDFSMQDREVLEAFKKEVESYSGDLDASAAMGLVDSVLDKLELGKGKVYKPIRVACSGMGSGPNLGEFLSLIGQDAIRNRLEWILSQ